MRALLIMITIVAVVCGSFSRRIARTRTESLVAAKIESSGGKVIYGNRVALPEDCLSGRLLTELLYEEVGRVTSVRLRKTDVSDEVLVNLAVFTRIDDLDLSQTSVTDPKLRHLTKLSTLRSVNLCQTGVSTLGVQQFKASSSPKIVLH